MKDLEKYKEEFNANYASVVDPAAINLSAKFDALLKERNSRSIMSTIQIAAAMLNHSYNIPTKMQICYDIANGYHDLCVISEEYIEQYLEKEIYYLRKTLDMYEIGFYADEDFDDNNPEPIDNKIANYIAMRTYTNLGNAMRALGRYVVAIDNFQNALIINNEFSMASLNLSFVLFSYAQLQIKNYEQNYYHHACYHYYEQTKTYKINLEDQSYLENLEKHISIFAPEYIEGFLSKPLNLPSFSVSKSEEVDYRNYILMSRLFLEPCLDILSDPCFAVDSITLPLNAPTDAKSKEFIGLFNQIKQEYNLARYLWYKTTVAEEPTDHFSDHEMDYIITGDDADFSLKEALLRTAFKTAYSIFDRIGYFINEYFHVGLTDTKISFKNVWKNELRDGTGNVYFTVPNPIVGTYSHNPMIQAMYWLQKDFFEDKKTNVTSPNAEPIFQMRNDMEHNCLRTGKQSFDVGFTKYTMEGKIEDNTYKLLKLAREAIIYLCLSINFEKKFCDKAQVEANRS